MRIARIGWAVWLTVVLVAFAGSANQPPQAEDVELSTWVGTPVSFVVTAADADTDGLDPATHPLRFILVVPPENGTLTGDFEDVLPNGQERSIALCYAPSGMSSGLDRFVIDVLDPFDARATVVISVDVRQPAEEGTFSGDAEVSLTIDPLGPSFPAFRTDLTCVYRYEGVTCEVSGSWKQLSGTTDDAFDDLKLDVRTLCSTLGSIAGRFDFDPATSTPLFEYAEARGEMFLDPLRMTALLHLASPQTSSYTRLGLSGPLPLGGSVSVSATLSDLCLCFESATVRLRFPDLLCTLAGDLVATFTQAGFEQATIAVDRIPVGRILVPEPASAFDLAASVTSTITLSDVHAGVSLEWIPPFVVPDCVELLVDSVLSGGAWSGFEVYGLKIEQAFSKAVSVSARTSLQPTDLATNARMTGFVDYWEALTLAGNLDLCSGIRGDWSVATYFGTTQTRLFDWGMTRLEFRAHRNAEFELSSTLYFRSGDLGDPTAEWVVGVVTHW